MTTAHGVKNPLYYANGIAYEVDLAKEPLNIHSCTLLLLHRVCALSDNGAAPVEVMQWYVNGTEGSDDPLKIKDILADLYGPHPRRAAFLSALGDLDDAGYAVPTVNGSVLTDDGHALVARMIALGTAPLFATAPPVTSIATYF
jgi:hypothetical protein